MNVDEISYKEVIDKYGENSQIVKLLREFSELEEGLMEFARDRGDVRVISEKVTDVKMELKRTHFIFRDTLLR